MATSAPANFYDLPGELRNEIYGLYIAGLNDQPLVLQPDGSLQHPALARTSQQVHIEFLSIWDALTLASHRSRNLQFCVLDLDFSPLLRFLKSVEFRMTNGRTFGNIQITLRCGNTALAVRRSARQPRLEAQLRVLNECADRVKYKVQLGNEGLFKSDFR